MSRGKPAKGLGRVGPTSHNRLLEGQNSRDVEPEAPVVGIERIRCARKKLSRVQTRRVGHGQLEEMSQNHGMTRMVFTVPTRGLLGYRSQFMTDTKGMGTMSYVFDSYSPYAGDIINRVNGVLVTKQSCTSVAYALFNLQDRGTIFIYPGEKLYAGQVVGENCRSGDLVVNPAKGKKLTNVRASGTDDAVVLTPPRVMTLEDCISFINDDELVEVTPKSIRLRKTANSKLRA